MSDSTGLIRAMPHRLNGSNPLVNRINELHSKGVGGLIDLPQMIICGNESSGERSILEEISQVCFPTKGSFTTRFVTMIKLHHSSKSLFKVAICPRVSENTDDDSSNEPFLLAFVGNTDDSLSLIEKASGMITSASNQQLCDDILEIEIAGPEIPDLIISHLPRLHNQSLDERAQLEDYPNNLAKRYMRNPRSIIIAVIPADVDLQSQTVLAIAAELDEKQERTIGLITHPDKLATNTKSSEFRQEIAKRRLKLGWHVFPNLRPRKPDASPEESDKNDQEALQGTKWDMLRRWANNGIESLPKWLNDIFAKHVRDSVHGMVSDIDAMVLDRQSKLPKLALPRKTLSQQREFMFSLSNSFERILDQALSGRYADAFFESPANGTQSLLCDPRRLYSLVRGLNNHFAEAIQVIGCRRIITEFGGKKSSFHNTSNPYETIRTPEYKERTTLEFEIGQQIHDSPDQLVMGALFRDQMLPWEDIARVHLMRTWKSARACVLLVLKHLIDYHTSDLIMRDLIDPKLEKLKMELLAKLKELTTYHKRAQPLPFSHSITARLNKFKNDRLLQKIKQRLPVFEGSGVSIEQLEMATQSLETSSRDSAPAEIIDQMQAHYDAAISTFVDNVAILAIENCLLGPLAKILTIQTMSSMDDTQLRGLAEEPRSTELNRKRLNSELKKLQFSSETLKEFNIPGSPPLLPSSGMTDSLVSGAALVVSPSGQSFLLSRDADCEAQTQRGFGAGMSFSTAQELNPTPIFQFQGAQVPSFGKPSVLGAATPVISASIGSFDWTSGVFGRPSASTTPPSVKFKASNGTCEPRLGKAPTTIDFPCEWFYTVKSGNGNGAVEERYQSVTFMQKFSKFSHEELRVADYESNVLLNHKKPE